MEPSELIEALRRLSKVHDGYVLTLEDKNVLRIAANNLEDLESYTSFVRAKAREILG